MFKGDAEGVYQPKGSEEPEARRQDLSPLTRGCGWASQDSLKSFERRCERLEWRGGKKLKPRCKQG